MAVGEIGLNSDRGQCESKLSGNTIMSSPGRPVTLAPRQPVERRRGTWWILAGALLLSMCYLPMLGAQFRLHRRRQPRLSHGTDDLAGAIRAACASASRPTIATWGRFGRSCTPAWRPRSNSWAPIACAGAWPGWCGPPWRLPAFYGCCTCWAWSRGPALLTGTVLMLNPYRNEVWRA